MASSTQIPLISQPLPPLIEHLRHSNLDLTTGKLSRTTRFGVMPVVSRDRGQYHRSRLGADRTDGRGHSR